MRIYMHARMHARSYIRARNSRKRTVNDVYVYIAHPESFRSNAQIAIAFARRNRPSVHRNDEFACVYLRSRAFAFASIVRD